jgi:hypothetical protein
VVVVVDVKEEGRWRRALVVDVREEGRWRRALVVDVTEGRWQRGLEVGVEMDGEVAWKEMLLLVVTVVVAEVVELDSVDS